MFYVVIPKRVNKSVNHLMGVSPSFWGAVYLLSRDQSLSYLKWPAVSERTTCGC